MCRALGVSRQGYYQWRSRPASEHERRDAELKAKILAAWEKGRRVYGSPRVYRELARSGVSTSEKRVARLMRELGLRGVSRRSAKRADDREKRVARGDSPTDQVKRDFTADGPNELWLADITYVRTHQGWLYLAVVMDIWSRRVVGWSMGPHITAELADDALKMAIERRRPGKGCVHHTDHGSQYASLPARMPCMCVRLRDGRAARMCGHAPLPCLLFDSVRRAAAVYAAPPPGDLRCEER